VKLSPRDSSRLLGLFCLPKPLSTSEPPNDPFTDLPFYKNNDRNGGWESSKYEWTSNPIALAYYTDDKRSQYTTSPKF